MKRFIPTVIGVLLASVIALGDSVDQGRPGKQGPWATGASTCNNPTHAVTSVGVTAVNCPATQLSGRRFIVLCNSSENTGTPKVKVLIDGNTPVMGITHAGDVLAIGDCATYAIPASVVPQCISDTAATAVTSLECK